MKTARYTFNNLLVHQVYNLPRKKMHAQRSIRNNGVNPEMIMHLQPSVNQASEKTVQLKKTKICIKNMVSLRCKMVVMAVLENLEINYSSVELGEVEIIGDISVTQLEELKSHLLICGLELIEDNKSILVEKIKKTIVEMIHYSDELPNLNFSDYLSQKMNHNYNYLSNLFSEVKGMSIQRYIISQKIELVKEMLLYDKLTLSEIAWKLHYSSVAHLSNQFKKITSITPTLYKNIKHKSRIALDRI